jgi:hypothetical protein
MNMALLGVGLVPPVGIVEKIISVFSIKGGEVSRCEASSDVVGNKQMLRVTQSVPDVIEDAIANFLRLYVSTSQTALSATPTRFP